MNTYRLIYTPEAELDLRELHAYIERKVSRRTATQYIQRLRAFCRSFQIAPHRGEKLVGTALRRIGFEDRVKVVFAVLDDERIVEIQGFDYGGRQRW